MVRTLIVYFYALPLLRWLGSRTVGQLSTIEFLLVIALGSAVSDAMFYPDVPTLHALLVVTVAICANKLLDVLIARSKTALRAIDGVVEEAIRDAKPTFNGAIVTTLRYRECGVVVTGSCLGS